MVLWGEYRTVVGQPLHRIRRAERAETLLDAADHHVADHLAGDAGGRQLDGGLQHRASPLPRLSLTPGVHPFPTRFVSGSIGSTPNCHNVFDASLPFGGYKQSGWGREMGEEVLHNYTEIKAVTAAL